ncbi:transposase [Micromonospora sp. NBC_00898]|uniref:transposase n=1 Tax=Micromonospora sp. NBC_00898 TaxID=2975981 RepID=UPI0038702389|nr:transposase [Micromonospora sp. NBC_00898]
MARPSQYPEQFRKDAVDLVRSSDRPLRQIARDLGVNHETLRGWVRAAEKQPGRRAAPTDLSVAERDELRKLRARVRELELEKDILRKAAQYFAKE